MKVSGWREGGWERRGLTIIGLGTLRVEVIAFASLVGALTSEVILAATGMAGSLAAATAALWTIPAEVAHYCNDLKSVSSAIYLSQ